VKLTFLRDYQTQKCRLACNKIITGIILRCSIFGTFTGTLNLFWYYSVEQPWCNFFNFLTVTPGVVNHPTLIWLPFVNDTTQSQPCEGSMGTAGGYKMRMLTGAVLIKGLVGHKVLPTVMVDRFWVRHNYFSCTRTLN